MSTSTQSLRDIAEQVYRLLRKFGPEPFERGLLEWAVAVDKPLAEFDAARAKHIFRAVNFDNRLCDQAAGPPEPDWEWESESVKIAHIKHDRSAWFPPELAIRNCPSLEYPLPLPDNRDLTPAENYAALVAIHAIWWKGEKIAPWLPNFNEEEYWACRVVPTDDHRSVSGWIFYRHLLSSAKKTPESDVRYLSHIIEDVAADLAEVKGGDPEQSKSEQAMQKGRPAAKPSEEPGGDGTPPATLVFLENPGPDPTRASYGLDCRSVNWYGQVFTFTPIQAACVKVLIEHYKHGVPELGEQTILECDQVKSSQNRLASVFDNGGHPAWGTMIKPGSTKGTVRLAKPGE